MARAPSGKPKRTGTKLLVGLLLLVPAVYVAVQLVTIAGRSSALLTQTAVLDTMAESVVCEGFLGMTEQSITYEGSGVLSYIAKNGERVSEGIGVARLFASEADAAQYKRYTALSQEIDLLTKAQATGSAAMPLCWKSRCRRACTTRWMHWTRVIFLRWKRRRTTSSLRRTN